MKIMVPVKRVLDYNVKPRVKADGRAWIWPTPR
jgi:electron transfer flavoprotein alpha/beta subunit